MIEDDEDVKQEQKGMPPSPIEIPSEATRFGITTPQSIASASLSFNMLSSIKSPASSPKQLAHPDVSSRLAESKSESNRANESRGEADRSYEENYSRAIQDLRELGNMASSTSRLRALMEKIKGTVK